MPRRNEREYEARRQQILDGALQAFAVKGFQQATNRDIAEAAGIGSPGLIYHYFKDKRALLQGVLQRHVPLLQLVSQPEEFMDLAPRDALMRFGRAYLRLLDTPESIALVKLVLGEAVRHPDFARAFFEVGPGRAMKVLAGYLQRQMDAGILRFQDPGLAARGFMGPLVLFVLSHALGLHPNEDQWDTEKVLATTVDIFLQGMQMPDNRSASRGD